MDAQIYSNVGQALAFVAFGAYTAWKHRAIDAKVERVDAKVDSNYGDLKADIDAAQTALNNLASKVAARTGSKPLPSTTDQWAAAQRSAADPAKQRYNPDVTLVRGNDAAP